MRDERRRQKAEGMDGYIPFLIRITHAACNQINANFSRKNRTLAANMLISFNVFIRKACVAANKETNHLSSSSHNLQMPKKMERKYCVGFATTLSVNARNLNAIFGWIIVRAACLRSPGGCCLAVRSIRKCATMNFLIRVHP